MSSSRVRDAGDSAAKIVDQVRASFNDLIREAERRRDMIGWPKSSMLSGVGSRPGTFEDSFDDKSLLMRIKTELSSFNIDVETLLMDFRQGPDSVDGPQAMDTAEAIERRLGYLRQLTNAAR
ncbi:hypothetical protein NXS19_003421 [Fusarium pseudograminearum]|nr:hypothetical protein NXS19_003421 [Fusarium pseudograminearum]